MQVVSTFDDDLMNAKKSVTVYTKPSAPIISSTSNSSTSILVFNINNNNPSNSLTISKNTVTFNKSGETPTTVEKNQNSTPQSVNATSIPDLSSNTTYTVTAKSTNSQSYESTTTSASLATKPIAPIVDSTTTNTTNSVTFNVTNNNVASTLLISKYLVTHNPSSGISQPVEKVPSNTAPNANAQSVQLSGLVANTSYAITTQNKNSKNEESSSSNSITMYTLPNAPIISTTDVLSNTTLTFNVNNNNSVGTMDISGYKITISPGSHGNVVPTGNNVLANASSVPVQLTGLDANTTYTITIKQFAQNDNDSASSNQITMTTTNT